MGRTLAVLTLTIGIALAYGETYTQRLLVGACALICVLVAEVSRTK
jgi:hypothetical protein